jgi:hypothetical protein
MRKPQTKRAPEAREMYVLNIGHRYFAAPHAVAVRLLADMPKLEEVLRGEGWRDPWRLVPAGTAQPAFESAELGKVLPASSPAEEPELLRITHQPLAIGRDRG